MRRANLEPLGVGQPEDEYGVRLFHEMQERHAAVEVSLMRGVERDGEHQAQRDGVFGHLHLSALGFGHGWEQGGALQVED